MIPGCTLLAIRYPLVLRCPVPPSRRWPSGPGALLLRCQILQAPLFPFSHTGGNMEPLFRRYRHQLNSIGWASNHAHSTADTLCPLHLCLAIFIVSYGFYRATLDARATGNTLFRINDGAVVRSLGRFLQTKVRGPEENTAAITAAVTRPDKLRSLSSHSESIERQVNVPHLLKFAKEL